jgi:sugar-phosphatase
MRFEVDAILFDIDGTLVDSTPVVERTWRTWAAEHGMDAEEILRVCHGRRSEDTIADLLPPSERAAAVEQRAAARLSALVEVNLRAAGVRIVP